VCDLVGARPMRLAGDDPLLPLLVRNWIGTIETSKWRLVMRLSAPPISRTRLEQLLAGLLLDSRQQEIGSGTRTKEGRREIHDEYSPSGSNSQ
jgi:hypothetical protein